MPASHRSLSGPRPRPTASSSSRWSSTTPSAARIPTNRGNPTDRTLNRYRNLFTGGAGLIVLEAITVGDMSVARTHQLSIVPRNAKAPAPLRRRTASGQRQAAVRRPAHAFRRDQRPLLQACRPEARWPVSHRSCSATRMPTGSSMTSSKPPRSPTMSAWMGST